MRRVVVYVPRVLPLSLTFVADQARSLTRWHPELVGRERVADGLPVDAFLAPEMQASSGASSLFPQVIGRVTRRVTLLHDVVDRTHPELIHAHFLTGGFDVVATLPEPPCPIVVTAHGFDATWYGAPPRARHPEQWLHGLLRRRLVRQPVLFVAVSHFIRDQLLGFGAPSSRVVVHHTGVDTTYFTALARGAERRGILFVGRLVPKKGVLDLLQAVAQLRSEGIEPPVEIIGDGPLRAEIERFVTRERLDVNLRGAQPREEVRAAMRRAAVLCNPSRTGPDGDREGFGMVLAEAQATGLPVVASASGGMVDAVDDGRTGLLVPEANPGAVAHALRRCLLDDELHARLSAAARPWVLEHFDLARQTEVLEDLYDGWSASTS